MNTYITEISYLVPMCSAMSRKLDKLTVLRLAVQHIKSLRGSVNSLQQETFKPNFASDEEMRNLLQQVSDGFVLVLSCDKGKVLHVSPQIIDDLRWTQTELSGQNIFEFIHPADVNVVKSQMSATNPNSDQINNDAKLFRRDDVTSSSSFNLSTNYADSSTIGFKRSFFCRLRAKSNDLVNSEPNSLHTRIPLKTAKHYVSVSCTGFLKSWPPALLMNGLESPNSSNDFDLESNFACLILLVRPLLSKEALVQSAYPNRPIGNFTAKLSVDGKIIMIDDWASHFLGFLPHNMIGSSYYEFMSKGHINRLAEIHEKALTGGNQPVVLSYQMQKSGGGLVSVVAKWQRFLNPWSNEIENLVVQHQVYGFQTGTFDSSAAQNQTRLGQDLKSNTNDSGSQGVPKFGFSSIGKAISDQFYSQLH